MKLGACCQSINFDYVFIHFTSSGKIDLLIKYFFSPKYVAFNLWIMPKNEIEPGSMAAEYVNRILGSGYNFAVYDWESLEGILK